MNIAQTVVASVAAAQFELGFTGIDVELVVDPDHAGTYLVAVEGYGVETHDVGAVPAYLSSPYTLTVENR